MTDSERDLGVIIGKDCKNSQQAEKSINQANIALGRMRKTFQFLNFVPYLHKTISRIRNACVERVIRKAHNKNREYSEEGNKNGIRN